jgi:S-DNA-T family DNA segregation ATPase FtsK/SpoIIIE
VEEPEEDEEDAAPPPKPPKKGRQAGLPMLPPIDLFTKPTKGSIAPIDLETKAATIEAKLASFGVGARVVGHRVGPTVTLFDVEPDPGVKVKRITELQNDLALALAAPTIRIQAPVPGRPVVGIEIPNSTSTLVTMREVLESDAYHAISSPLRVAMGKDVSGGAVCIDLARMPHLLIAGATGSGKSSLINVIICGLLYQNRPEDVRLVMIDPKMVELSVYNKVPHLYLPVVTDMDKVLGVLRWTLREMERRYALFRDSGARNLSRYNQMLDQRGEKRLPFIVVVIDELADLMMVAPDDVEACVIRLAQLARATGIHLVIATQRPSVDVVTGLIKANFPARIAFAMSSQVDSRTILDQVGAEKLLGRGDMLYQDPSAPRPVRLQGAYLSDREIERLVDFWNNLEVPTEQVAEEEIEARAAEEEAQLDPLFDQAKEVVRQFKHASISLLQRRLSVGYQRASRLMDQLENQGVVATAEDGKSRRVLPVEEGEAEAEPRESI